MFFGFAWAWLALAGRKAIPWLVTSFRDFEPPEYVPRTLARARTCTQCSHGPPVCPVTKSKSKDPRSEEQKIPMSEKKFILYTAINIYIAQNIAFQPEQTRPTKKNNEGNHVCVLHVLNRSFCPSHVRIPSQNRRWVMIPLLSALAKWSYN